MAENKAVAIGVLGVVACIAIVGLVMLFNASTQQVSGKAIGQGRVGVIIPVPQGQTQKGSAGVVLPDFKPGQQGLAQKGSASVIIPDFSPVPRGQAQKGNASVIWPDFKPGQ
jgi:hypothetical protein